MYFKDTFCVVKILTMTRFEILRLVWTAAWKSASLFQLFWLLKATFQERFLVPSRFCMVYSEVPNFSEANPELLAQTNQQNKSVSDGE